VDVLGALYQGQPDLARRLAGEAERLNLAEAAALDEVDRVAELLDDGGEADARTPDGFTPLHLAAFFGAPRVAALLLERGADPGAVAGNEMRVQPLHSAAAGRHRDIAIMLIAAGVDVDARQQAGYTPLLAVANSGDIELARALLAAGADPDLANDTGVRPAELAAERGHHELADLLSTARTGTAGARRPPGNSAAR
jgi:ankyrin repeat protein